MHKKNDEMRTDGVHRPQWHRLKQPVLSGILALSLVGPAGAQSRVDTDEVFGMVSGLALLMDVHYPEQPNGRGILMILGGGVTAPGAMDGEQLKAKVERPPVASTYASPYAHALLEHGFTVFVTNRRLRPHFSFVDAYEDVQRAVRFVRHNAVKYGIEAERLGLWGDSAGSLLGSLAVLGAPALSERSEDDLSEIERANATVTAAVLIGTPVNLTNCSRDESRLCEIMRWWTDYDSMTGDAEADEMFAKLSPINHVSSDDPPVLLIHGDQDPLVPYEGAVRLEAALKNAGVTTELLRVRDGDHDLRTPNVDRAPDEVFAAMVRWFDRHLFPKR